MPPKSRRLLQRQSHREDAQSLSPTPQPPLPPLSNTTTAAQSLSPRPLRNTTTTAHSVTPPPPPPLSNTTTAQSISHPPPPPPRNTATTAHSVTPPPHPPLSNTTTAQSISHPPPPSPRNTTTAQSLSPPPPPPPLLNTTLVASSSTAGGEAPAATLRSIRCKNAEDGFSPWKMGTVTTQSKKCLSRATLTLQYALGDGVVGRVARTGDNKWVFFHDSVAGELSSPNPEFPEEWNLQVTAGIETVLLVPLMPYGVLQLGSFDKVPHANSRGVPSFSGLSSGFPSQSASPSGSTYPVQQQHQMHQQHSNVPSSSHHPQLQGSADSGSTEQQAFAMSVARDRQLQQRMLQRWQQQQQQFPTSVR